jgi:UDP-N-acetylglucosamine 1-carboxyvinyltransferase
MDKFVIEGGVRLSGSVEVNSSKNAILPIITAALLVEKGWVVLNDVPDLADIDTILKVIEGLGAKVTRSLEERKVAINAEGVSNHKAPYELVRKMRASFLVMGPLLARLGKAEVSLPGGCVLGARPVDQHLKGFQALGAQLSEESGYVTAESKELKGNVICFDRPTHTGTENVMMAAVLASSKTTLINAACDPEVKDVADFLNQGGAKISGAGTSVIEITGVKRLKPGEYTVIPDRLEAGTLMIATAITGGYLELKNIYSEHLSMALSKLREAGCEIEINGKRLKLRAPRKPKPLDVSTYPFPGFPTDLQPQIMSLCTLAGGISHIKETVFESRFTQIMELVRLGAEVKIANDEATVTGVNQLKGAQVMASDIRAGAGLVTACLAAQGSSEVLRVYHIDRGYERIEEKLSRLGAKIRRMAT